MTAITSLTGTGSTTSAAIFFSRYLEAANAKASTAMERLTSGRRINTAADDAAGLAISERLLSQSNGYAQARRNIQDGVSLLNVADAGLGAITNALQRSRDIIVRAANGTWSTEQRLAMNAELDGLTAEINDIVKATTFNGQTLLDGSLSGASGLRLQVGAGANDSMTVEIDAADALSLEVGDSAAEGSWSWTDVSTPTANFAGQIARFDAAIGAVSSMRANVGAATNRLGHAANLAAAQEQNTVQAYERITGADMAAETANLSAAQIRRDAVASLLAQANLSNQRVAHYLLG